MVVVLLAPAGAIVLVSCVVVVVDVAGAGSFTTVVQELRIAAMVGTIQMIVSFFIIRL